MRHEKISPAEIVTPVLDRDTLNIAAMEKEEEARRKPPVLQQHFHYCGRPSRRVAVEVA